VARSARSSAGREVLRLAQRFSDDLLVHENQCFALMQSAWRAAEATGRKTVESRLRAVGTLDALAGDGVLRVQMTRLFSNAASAIEKPVLATGHTAVALAAEAIGKELSVCEKTLAQRYVGVSKIAAAAAETVGEQVLKTGFQAFVTAEASARSVWLTAMQMQLRRAGAEKETVEQAVERLFGSEPVRLPGCSGRGAWWQSESTLEASAREMVIACANTVRETGMTAMNDAGDAVDGVSH
jgi:hypothetical protein